MDSPKATQRIISLCPGIRGLERGMELAGFKHRVICHVEIEAFICTNLVQEMEQGLVDQAPIWTDLKTFDAKPFRGMVEGITGGYPCFIAGSLVLTKRGYQPIEDVKVGDIVLTHLGRWRSVTSTMHTKNVKVQSVSSQGSPNITCTPEHPFYARKLGRQWDNGDRKYIRKWGAANWVEARNLKDHFTSQILPKEINCGDNVDVWWVIGRYLADGWMQKSPSHKNKGRINICCARKEADFLESRIRQAGFVAYKSEERTTTRFAITRKWFYERLQDFGKYSHGKFLPGYAFEINQECATSLLDGYFSGDGSIESSGEVRATTVSKRLAYSMALLAQRAYGVVASITKNKSRGDTIIEGRTVSQRDTYIIHIPTRNRSAFISGEYGWKCVRKCESGGRADVFNIAVEEDESYVVENCLVHNCQPFSLAGKRCGEDDDRHLWPYIRQIIDAAKPVWCFFENVDDHLTLGFDQVYRDLRDLGYSVEAGVFSAEEVGAPHERQRVFILALENPTALRWGGRSDVGSNRRWPLQTSRSGALDNSDFSESVSLEYASGNGRRDECGECESDKDKIGDSEAFEERRSDIERGTWDASQGKVADSKGTGSGRIKGDLSEENAQFGQSKKQSEDKIGEPEYASEGDMVHSTSRRLQTDNTAERVCDESDEANDTVGLANTHSNGGSHECGEVGTDSGESKKKEHGKGRDKTQRERSGANSIDSGEHVGQADTFSTGHEGSERGRTFSKQGSPTHESASERCESPRWPAGPGSKQYEWEEPRTKIKSCLGDPNYGKSHGRNVLFVEYAAEKERTYQALHSLWNRIEASHIQWTFGGLFEFFKEEILFTGMLRQVKNQRLTNIATIPEKILSFKGFSLRTLWREKMAEYPSQRQECIQQLQAEFANALCVMSYQVALARREETNPTKSGDLQLLWDAEFKNKTRVLLEAFPEVENAWASRMDENNSHRAFIQACQGFRLEFDDSMREDYLRAIGNSVVPWCAAKAWVTLWNKMYESISLYRKGRS